MGQQEIVGGSALRRLVLVLAVAVLMAAMMVAMAVPAFAKADPLGHPGSNNAPYASLDIGGGTVTTFRALPPGQDKPVDGQDIGGKGDSQHGNPGQETNKVIPLGGP
jgi:hypothetical protein